MYKISRRSVLLENQVFLVSVQVCRLEFFITKARVEMVFQPSIIDTQQGLCVCPMKYCTLRASSGAEAVGFDHR